MRTLELENIKIEETKIMPDSSLRVRYRIVDDSGNVISRKTVIIRNADVSRGKTALTNFLSRLLT